MNFSNLFRIVAISMFFANSTTYTMEAESSSDEEYVYGETVAARSSEPVTKQDIKYSNLSKVGTMITDKDIKDFNQGKDLKKKKWYLFYKK